jgi:integrase
MPSIHLTKKYLDNIDRPDKGVVRCWDTEIKGFVAYVQCTTTTLYYQRNIRDKTKRVLLGRYPTISLSQARTSARTFDLEMRQGKAKELLEREVTLKEALSNYLQTSEAVEQHKLFVKRAIEVRLADWNEFPLREITMSMVSRRHILLTKEGPVMADETMRALRSVWNTARLDYERTNLPSCPTDVLQKKRGKRTGWNNPEPKRNRPIVDLYDWRCHVQQITNPIHRDFYLFLLLTACRKSEITSLKWEQINRNGSHLHLPKTKSGREHFLPLNEHHFQILDRIPVQCDYIFPEKTGTGPLVSPRHEEVPGTLHSLRHTWASVAAEIGFGEDQIGRILNHAHSGNRTVTNRYIHVHINSLRPIMDTVTEELTQRLNRESTIHNIVCIREQINSA